MRRQSLVPAALAFGLALCFLSAGRLAPPGTSPATREAVKHPMFLPPPLDDDWNRWLVGEWISVGQTDTGSGDGTVRVEMGLNGQFRVHTEEGRITEMTPQQAQYLKRNMHASDEEIRRFKSQPYRAMEIYTIDQVTGETVGYLFDSLRCIATGRGRREGDRETVHWAWATGHKSTRITQKVGGDRLEVIQRTPMPDGSVMEEKGHATRRKRPPAATTLP